MRRDRAIQSLLGAFLTGILLVTGCARTPMPVEFPLPVLHTRPAFDTGFTDCQEGLVCLKPEDARILLQYLILLERDVKACRVTVEEINRMFD